VSGGVSFGGEISDAYSLGPASTSLSGTQIQNIVAAFSNGLSKSATGVPVITGPP
jgi:hypothetical protein